MTFRHQYMISHGGSEDGRGLEVLHIGPGFTGAKQQIGRASDLFGSNETRDVQQ